VAELVALYSTCQGENGLVCRGRPDDAPDAGLIDPPVAAYAAARLVLTGDADARAVLECATRQLDAIWGERLPPDTDLPVILHPLESATPGTPLFDELVEWVDDEEERADELATIARSAAACRLDPERALRAGHGFVVEDPVFCGWFLLALEEVQTAWEKLGDGATARKLGIRSRMIADAVMERLWWEEEQVFVARDRLRDAPLKVLTAGGLVPAASRLLQEDGRVRSAIARHLAPTGSPLWGSHGISFNPIVRDRVTDEGSPWRGNAASALTQYWAHLVLTRTGRGSDARVARAQLESNIETHGFREYFDALTGEPRGAEDCLLPCLVLDMDEPL
jgi:hypothetical protein